MPTRNGLSARVATMRSAIPSMTARRSGVTLAVRALPCRARCSSVTRARSHARYGASLAFSRLRAREHALVVRVLLARHDLRGGNAVLVRNVDPRAMADHHLDVRLVTAFLQHVVQRRHLFRVLPVR